AAMQGQRARSTSRSSAPEGRHSSARTADRAREAFALIAVAGLRHTRPRETVSVTRRGLMSLAAPPRSSMPRRLCSTNGQSSELVRKADPGLRAAAVDAADAPTLEHGVAHRVDEVLL